jgi:hypothetical protein
MIPLRQFDRTGKNRYIAIYTIFLHGNPQCFLHPRALLKTPLSQTLHCRALIMFPFAADETLILALIVFLVALFAGTDTSRNCRVDLIAAAILAIVPFFRLADAVSYFRIVGQTSGAS